MGWAKTTARRDENHSSFGIWCAYIRCLMVFAIIIPRYGLAPINSHTPKRATHMYTLNFYMMYFDSVSFTFVPWGQVEIYVSHGFIVLTLEMSTLSWDLSGHFHYDDVIMTTIASQITSITVVYSIVYSDADQRKHQSSASLAFVWGIHRDRWIPRTKGQLRGKCFHLMTASCWKTPSGPKIVYTTIGNRKNF